jgi:aspartyl/asparaginyl-tRNA synthetase
VLAQNPVEIDKPLDHHSEALETLFDYRVVGLRNFREQAIFKIQAAVKEAARKHFRANDFTEFNSPKLLPGATEGGAEVFKLDYFGKDATLAQSGQFYKQIMVGVFERAFEINPTYRAEPSATTRHMTEFMHIDAEMGFIDFQELLDFMSGLLNGIVDDVWAHSESYLKEWNATKPILTEKIPQIPLEEVHKTYTEATGTKTIGEKDLRPDEERFICEWAKEHLKSEAVFVTEWPREGAKFYHRFKDGDQEVAERADLLFRGVEIATASMREHRYDKLVTQLRGMAGGDPEAFGFRYYLDAFKYGMPPHGGFGMGLERLTQKIIGLHNVKEASLFPRDINRLGP